MAGNNGEKKSKIGDVKRKQNKIRKGKERKGRREQEERKGRNGMGKKIRKEREGK